jgi:hypothetical protein
MSESKNALLDCVNTVLSTKLSYKKSDRSMDQKSM